MVTLTAGETFQAEIKADSKATVVVQFAGPQHYTIPVTRVDDKFTLIADTSGWKPGDYIWEAWSMLGNIKSVLIRQNFTLRPSVVDILINTDIRSTTRKAVENIQAMIAGGASLEARRYKINNRELERYSIPELLQLLSYWEKKLSVEERRSKGLSTLGPRIEFRI